jgi:hypothetical protein
MRKDLFTILRCETGRRKLHLGVTKEDHVMHSRLSYDISTHEEWKNFSYDLITIFSINLWRAVHHFHHLTSFLNLKNTPSGGVLLQELIVVQLIKKFPTVYGTESSIPASEDSATGAQSRSIQSKSLFFYIFQTHFIAYYSATYAWVSQVEFSLQIFRLRFCTH